MRVNDEWIGDCRAEFVELKSDLPVRVRLSSQEPRNQAPRLGGYQVSDHASSLLAESRLLFFC